MQETANVLDIQNLTVHYVLEEETVEAVNDISIKLARGKVLGLVGETGAGKTTTALACMRLVPDPPGVIKGGKIFVDGIDMLGLTSKELESIRGNDISMIFQDPMTSLNPVFTVGEQIAESIWLHEKVSKNEALLKAEKMLEIVGIPASRSIEYPHQFSGGMRQRVIIAIALACNPKLLIADEPTTALDVTIQAQVMELIKQLVTANNTSMLMITHDLGVVAQVCDFVSVMYAGRIVEHGTLEDVFTRPSHPYTEGLFNCLPNIHKHTSELVPIPGLMPDPSQLPVGCSFAPRCRYADSECGQKLPERIDFCSTHYATCSAYSRRGFKLDVRK